VDPFNFANNLLRLYETRVDHDRMIQARQEAWLKRHAAAGRPASAGSDQKHDAPAAAGSWVGARILMRATSFGWPVGVARGRRWLRNGMPDS